MKENVIYPGIYKLEDRVYEINEEIKSFDSILGIPLFKFKDKVVSHEDLHHIN